MVQVSTDADSVRAVKIVAGSATLLGDLTLPSAATGVVLFAHGSGSSRKSTRNRLVASQLNARGLATLLLDLLTETEEQIDRIDARLRFDIGLLAERLIAATDWLATDRIMARLPAGYFGASTGAAAALVAGAMRPDRIKAIVSRGGRPDLADEALAAVAAPTLLIVGGDDERVIPLNESALGRLGAQVKELVIVPGATHLFEEPGALDEVARLAADWFGRHLSVKSLSG
jgi:pimeloyl-ACP methyl ester carboxylesterase